MTYVVVSLLHWLMSQIQQSWLTIIVVSVKWICIEKDWTMDLLFGRHEQHIISQLTNTKIDKGMSVGKIYGAIEGFVSGTVVAFTTIFG